MGKPFDAALKAMLEAGPADWVAFLGHPGRPAAVIDADVSAVSAVSAASDKVVRVGGRRPWLLDVNFQTGPDAGQPRRMHRRGLGAGPPDVEFRYQVVRVWELPPEALLAAGPSVVPLAPIGAVPPGGLAGVVKGVGERLDEPGAAELAPEMWTAASILMGLQYDRTYVRRLIREVRGMAESVTFAVIQEFGAIRHSRRMLLRMGAVQFGEPPDEARAAVEGIDDLDYLDALSVQLLKVKSWAELLATPRPVPPPKPARGRRRTKSS